MATQHYNDRDQNLLKAAMSALAGHMYDKVTYDSKSEHNTSMFDYHRQTYNYGTVSHNTDDGKIEVHVADSSGAVTKYRIEPHNTVEQLKNMIQKRQGAKPDQYRLVLAGRQLEDPAPLNSAGINDGSKLHLVLRTTHVTHGGSTLDLSTLHPSYDYDFTNLTDEGEEFSRGSHPYVRPCGWRRFAIKVTGKFENEKWLGSSNQSGEWPVSYHGTGMYQAKNFATSAQNLTRRRDLSIQHGVFSTPDYKLAGRYAIKFSFEGDNYLVILQNRVNPETLVKVPSGESGVGDYWISPSEKDVRPYGICIRKA